jgi:hypothetical protein
VSDDAPTVDRYWLVQERTYDPRREIGSMSATRTEWERRLDHDPISAYETERAAHAETKRRVEALELLRDGHEFDVLAGFEDKYRRQVGTIRHLQRECDDCRRVLWLAVRRLGGLATFTPEEIVSCPHLPGLTAWDDHATGGRIVRADVRREGS